MGWGDFVSSVRRRVQRAIGAVSRTISRAYSTYDSNVFGGRLPGGAPSPSSGGGSGGSGGSGGRGGSGGSSVGTSGGRSVVAETSPDVKKSIEDVSKIYADIDKKFGGILPGGAESKINLKDISGDVKEFLTASTKTYSTKTIKPQNVFDRMKEETACRNLNQPVSDKFITTPGHEKIKQMGTMIKEGAKDQFTNIQKAVKKVGDVITKTIYSQPIGPPSLLFGGPTYGDVWKPISEKFVSEREQAIKAAEELEQTKVDTAWETISPEVVSSFEKQDLIPTQEEFTTKLESGEFDFDIDKSGTIDADETFSGIWAESEKNVQSKIDKDPEIKKIKEELLNWGEKQYIKSDKTKSSIDQIELQMDEKIMNDPRVKKIISDYQSKEQKLAEQKLNPILIKAEGDYQKQFTSAWDSAAGDTFKEKLGENIDQSKTWEDWGVEMGGKFLKGTKSYLGDLTPGDLITAGAETYSGLKLAGAAATRLGRAGKLFEKLPWGVKTPLKGAGLGYETYLATEAFIGSPSITFEDGLKFDFKKGGKVFDTSAPKTERVVSGLFGVAGALGAGLSTLKYTKGMGFVPRFMGRTTDISKDVGIGIGGRTQKLLIPERGTMKSMFLRKPVQYKYYKAPIRLVDPKRGVEATRLAEGRFYIKKGEKWVRKGLKKPLGETGWMAQPITKVPSYMKSTKAFEKEVQQLLREGSATTERGARIIAKRAGTFGIPTKETQIFTFGKTGGVKGIDVRKTLKVGEKISPFGTQTKFKHIITPAYSPYKQPWISTKKHIKEAFGLKPPTELQRKVIKQSLFQLPSKSGKVSTQLFVKSEGLSGWKSLQIADQYTSTYGVGRTVGKIGTFTQPIRLSNTQKLKILKQIHSDDLYKAGVIRAKHLKTTHGLVLTQKTSKKITEEALRLNKLIRQGKLNKNQAVIKLNQFIKRHKSPKLEHSYGEIIRSKDVMEQDLSKVLFAGEGGAGVPSNKLVRYMEVEPLSLTNLKVGKTSGSGYIRHLGGRTRFDISGVSQTSEDILTLGYKSKTGAPLRLDLKTIKSPGKEYTITETLESYAKIKPHIPGGPKLPTQEFKYFGGATRRNTKLEIITPTKAKQLGFDTNLIQYSKKQPVVLNIKPKDFATENEILKLARSGPWESKQVARDIAKRMER